MTTMAITAQSASGAHLSEGDPVYLIDEPQRQGTIVGLGGMGDWGAEWGACDEVPIVAHVEWDPASPAANMRIRRWYEPRGYDPRQLELVDTATREEHR